MTGPLSGISVVELAGIGPALHVAMMLSDMGAEVVRVDRLSAPDDSVDVESARVDVYLRGRRSIAVDLKSEAGLGVVFRLIQDADVLIEGFRPGVLERLGLAPERLLASNPRLVIGRVTGWGQDGPYASMAGHDINYIALAGALHGIGRPDSPPPPPLNYVGDFGGGSMLLFSGSSAPSSRRTGRAAARSWTPRWWTVPRSSELRCMGSWPKAVGPRPGALTISTEARRTTIRTDAKTAETSPSQHSNRSSTLKSAVSSGWTDRCGKINTIVPAGPRESRRSPNCSLDAINKSGVNCSRARTPASPLSSRLSKPRPIRTMLPARRSSSRTMLSSRHPPRD